jgi:hypothetical protein
VLEKKIQMRDCKAGVMGKRKTEQEVIPERKEKN